MTPEGGRDAKTEHAAAVQRQALDPGASVWVGASAGTGKTKVLTDRVASLLLHGTPPGRILCLTFTKAAAAEMANRLAERLAAWSVLEESALRDDLRALLGPPPDADLLARARRLFASVLDTPGGIKIQTIHAFCESLLGRFPLEAGVAPHAQVLDERSAAEILEEARREVLGRIVAQSSALAGALATVSATTYESGFDELLGELLRERARFARLRARHGDLDGLIAALYRGLECRPEETREDLLAAAASEGAFDRAGLTAAAAAMLQGGTTDQRHGTIIGRWLAAEPTERARQTEAYLEAYFKDGGAGDRRAKLIYKEALALAPGADKVLADEAERLAALRGRLAAVKVGAATAALLRLGERILERYKQHKQRRGLLDYDDLILKARDLLRKSGAAAWVLYKLDGGLDHILIDEAQDTNPEQWDVIADLSEEFFAGAGARDTVRTVFAVGDAKQSIFSFQRAAPEAFSKMREHFAERARDAGQGWEQVDLKSSFRSTAAVLEAVDAVFGDAAGLGAFIDRDAGGHDPVRVGQAGLVELWPPVSPDRPTPRPPWQPPEERAGRNPAPLRLARLIARKIRAWTLDPALRDDPDTRLASRDRRLLPGDFLILVRRRNQFFDAMVRALKQEGVPVAGADRMVLTEQMAIMDLIALGRCLLMPEDDLTLATVLKGPLFGLDEDQLFRLAHDRRGPLWAELPRRAEEDPAIRSAHERLEALRSDAVALRPYEFYAGLLGPGGGRAALAANLGQEARDPIEEFLSQALAYERTETPTLEGFLHWLEASNLEVKRDMELGGDSVRVMTVHGAKGLQAPVVILPDTMQEPQPKTGLLWSEEDGAVVWPLRKAFDGKLAGRARAAVEATRKEEYRRLLYVAMTRAEDRLYIAGWETLQGRREKCWYSLVRNALADIAEETSYDFKALMADGWAGPGLRLAHDQDAAPELGGRREKVAAPVAPPPWIADPAPPEPSPPRPLAPSRPRAADPPSLSPLGADPGRRFRRGLLVHRLLESLPELPAGRRREAGRAFLDSAVHGLEPGERDEILAETLAILEEEAFAPLFGPDSRAEVALTGVIEGPGGPEAVSGQVDRLVVGTDRVMVVDYKTNRPAPRDPAEVPQVYLAQMALYRRILAEIYPGRAIDTCLLWTDGPRIMPLSHDLLASQFP